MELHVRRTGVLLATVLLAVVAGATPAAAEAAPTPTDVTIAAAPTCGAGLHVSTLTYSASCTNGDPAIAYRITVLCSLSLTSPIYEFDGVGRTSAWTPTTQPILNIGCVVGWPRVALIDVQDPPPPPRATLSCESGNYHFRCSVSTGLTGSLTIFWYVNGGRLASYDNLRSVSGGCQPGNKFTVTVTNSTGSATAAWSGCSRNPWP
jgi:hypothetical protein